MPGCYAVFHKQLGDLLLLEPALARLRDHHGSPIRVFTRNGHEPLLRLMPGRVFQRGLALRWSSHLYCFDPLNKSAFRSLITPAGVKRCILPEKREMAWFHRPIFGEIIVPELGDRYVAEYFWANTPVPASEPFRPPVLERPPEDWRPPAFPEGPFLLLNPTAGWRQKNWLPERWVETLRALHQATGLPAVMTCASTDWQLAHCREISAGTGGILRSLASGTSLENFLWLCSRARCVLTVDGSASHLAQAFGTPSLTIFGPTSLANWHFPGLRHRALQAPPSKDGARRLRNLPAVEVIGVARQILG